MVPVTSLYSMVRLQMNWKGFRNKLSWSNRGMFYEYPRKTTKHIKITGVSAEIRNQHLQNRSLQRCHSVATAQAIRFMSLWSALIQYSYWRTFWNQDFVIMELCELEEKLWVTELTVFSLLSLIRSSHIQRELWVHLGDKSLCDVQRVTLSSSEANEVPGSLFRSVGFCGFQRHRNTILEEWRLTKSWWQANFSLRRLTNNLIRFQLTFSRKWW